MIRPRITRIADGRCWLCCLTGWPSQAATSQQVQMDVKDRAEPALRVTLLMRKGGRAAHHFPHQLIVLRRKLVQGGDVTLRDDQRMQRSLRIDVLEGDQPLVLIDDR